MEEFNCCGERDIGHFTKKLVSLMKMVIQKQNNEYWRNWTKTEVQRNDKVMFNNKCDCSNQDLMRQGCKCGGV